MKFHATLELHGKTATGIAVPADVVEAISGGKRAKVTVTLGGHSYRTTVTPMGGQFLIPVAAENRTAAGLTAGDTVEVDIVLDNAPREVEMPADLSSAMGTATRARETYDSLSFTHRKEWVRWVEEAKKPETRATRIEKTVAALMEGKKTR